MQTRFRSTVATRRTIAVLFAVLACGIGCSETDSDYPDDVTPMPAPTPTQTPEEHHGPPHSIMEVGSTADGTGQLTVNEVPTAFVIASSCLGGTGDDCIGGIVAYTGDSPGFNDVREDSGDPPPYKLLDGTEVQIEITAIEADASLLISGEVLAAVGDMAVVNTSPELHNHPVWQIVAPGGVEVEDKSISFRLHAEGYESSDEISVTLSLFEGDDDHDDDDEDEDDHDDDDDDDDEHDEDDDD